MKTLLIEGEEALRSALRGHLERAGHPVLEACTLAEAKVRLRDSRPHVVLINVKLPDGNGIDFLADQKERLAESAVFVMAANGSIEDAVRAMKLGATDFLASPSSLDDEMRIVEKLVDNHPHGDIVPLDEIEFIMVHRALRAARGNQSQAARLLQVTRDQLRYRVKRYRELGRLPADLVLE